MNAANDNAGSAADTPSVVLQLPVPPSLNALWIHPPGRRGRVRSPEYAQWITVAGWEARRQLVAVPRIEGAFRAAIVVPQSSRRDLDNWPKALLDLAQTVGAIANDSGMRSFTVDKAARTDVLLALYDLGGPAIREGRRFREPGRRSYPAKLSAAALRFAKARVGL